MNPRKAHEQFSSIPGNLIVSLTAVVICLLLLTIDNFLGLFRERRLIGGVGMKRGRSRAFGIQTGDAIDFWRVERAEAPKTVLLRAEIKLPGEAWLQFDLTPLSQERALLRCCAWFQPRGLAGEVYWTGLYPVHAMIFSGMLRAIRKNAER